MSTTYYRPTRQPGFFESLKSTLLSVAETFRLRMTGIDKPHTTSSLSMPYSKIEDGGTAVSASLLADNGRDSMVFRKESRHDSFQRQISALRQQLSADQDENDHDDAEPMTPMDFQSFSEFDSSPEPLTLAPATIQPVDGDTGVIAYGSSWNGTLVTSGSLHVYGAVEGEILADADVFVADGAVVDAKVTAANVIVAGRIGGSIECRGRLEIWPTGHVSGEVRSPSLVVHEGATVDGKVAMQSTGS